MPKCLALTLLLLPLGLWAGSEGPDRDFSGNWILDSQQSELRALSTPPGATLKIAQQGATVHCTEADKTGNAMADWSFRTDGEESSYQLNGSRLSTETKWEGSALLINTLVSGTQNYALMDRWKLSKDHSVLTITRTIERGGSEHEATLVYQSPERAAAIPKPSPAPAGAAAAAASDARTPPTAAPGFLIEAGTKIPLSLVNSLNTRYSAEGDRVYLETVFPITQRGRIVIPKGSYVSGTVTEVKRGARLKGKPELFLRFDSLTLPNGVTRDFRSRLDSADTGKVDRQEGKIQGEGDKPGDARKIGEAAGAGAGVGGIAGAAAGHPGMGVGIGALGGAAAGLAGVLLSHGPDLVLPKGTTVEMVLDRPLHFEPHELLRN